MNDSDTSHYITKYLIGTHFWVDSNKDGIYQEGVEDPIPNALVELFDANGIKIAETMTNENGEYSFYVDPGDYYVRFNLPEYFKEKGFVFEEPRDNDDNNLNINNANSEGFTRLVSVGPDADEQHKTSNLTLDGAINCGCDVPGIEQGSGSTLSRTFAILMLLITLLIGVREVEKQK